MENLKSGIHSLTVKTDKIVVESNFGRSSMVSVYSPEEHEEALACFNRLISFSLTQRPAHKLGDQKGVHDPVVGDL
jgi:hypothetical protein